MSTWDVIRNLLPLIGAALILGGAKLVQRLERKKPRARVIIREAADSIDAWPRLWLAVKAPHLFAVQTALGLRNAKPCSWTEGISGAEGLFVARPVNGWTLIVGAALPDPSDDIDLCFRFVCRLSRRIGEVQLFYSFPALRYHAWIMAKRGRILRAYAWAGKTLWNQGRITPEEVALGLRCFDYVESPESLSQGDTRALEENAQKVRALAACWGPNPADFSQLSVEGNCGILGAPSREL